MCWLSLLGQSDKANFQVGNCSMERPICQVTESHLQLTASKETKHSVAYSAKRKIDLKSIVEENIKDGEIYTEI